MDFKELLNAAEFTPRSYSGRGMYGRKCISITCNNQMEAVSNILRAAIDLKENEREFDDSLFALADTLEETKVDSMGRGIVMYWPSIAFEGEEGEDKESEDD